MLERLDQMRIPVDVVALARQQGVELSYRLLDATISGLLFRDDEITLIGVNKRQPLVRQRFTIAHELGHLAMHRGRPILLDTSVRVNWRDSASELATDAEEIEANRFAAALLMPMGLTRQHVAQIVLSESDIDPATLVRRMAEAFHVSKEAMNFRLIGLGLQRTS